MFFFDGDMPVDVEVFFSMPSLGLDGAKARAAIELREDRRAREGIMIAN